MSQRTDCLHYLQSPNVSSFHKESRHGERVDKCRFEHRFTGVTDVPVARDTSDDVTLWVQHEVGF